MWFLVTNAHNDRRPLHAHHIGTTLVPNERFQFSEDMRSELEGDCCGGVDICHLVFWEKGRGENVPDCNGAWCCISM